MRTGIIVQARMNSRRLPGKVMLPIKGKPMLSYLLERLKHVKKAEALIIATTYHKESDAIHKLCRELNVLCVRGSERDVLSRYIKAIERYNLDAVVRLTSDNPLVDPSLVDEMIDEFKGELPQLDYLENVYNSGYPIGYCVEVIRSEALKKAFAEAEKDYQHEHVTPYLVENNEKFRTAVFERKKASPNFRLTVDTKEDFMLATWIIENLYAKDPLFTLDNVIELLERCPEMTKINEGVKQISIIEGEQ